MPSALSTDLYEITMMAGYRAAGMNGIATFELYVRDLPPGRQFLVAAGIEQALDYLARLRFEPEEIEYLRRLPVLASAAPSFFDDFLPAFRFTGEVWAVDEGTPVFPLEPVVRVTAPLPQAQLVEMALLSILGFQTSVASKAARMSVAAAGRTLAEFGGRRAHGTEAAVLAARAGYLAGCHSTSNVEAGHRFGIPVSGTMAHSWVMAFASEAEAFESFVRLYGRRSILLVDTYDTLAAARTIVELRLHPTAVRLDSGNLVELSRGVREIFDRGGLTDVAIIASGDLDEYRIAELVEAGTPITGFGVGTSLTTSKDAPALAIVYKMVETERDGAMVPTWKRSTGKLSLPGRKQVWRTRDGEASGDVVTLADEQGPAGSEPLLRLVMRDGRRLAPAPRLTDLRASCLAQVAQLPQELRQLSGQVRYPVTFGRELERLAERTSGRSTR